MENSSHDYEVGVEITIVHIQSVILALSYAPGFGVLCLVVLGELGQAGKIGLADAFTVIKHRLYDAPFPV